ncbi:hypothetical protein [Salinispora cortesiana]|uniref:hypothetical protein n=1 Tax=Salinispora cortesiana TaxID=1305843 RepID=UPI0004A4CC4D|nr:hypothetical protein [Salinispora cortesiana]
MNHQHRSNEPGHLDRSRIRPGWRWWAAGLAGMTGLTLTTAIGAAPAASAVEHSFPHTADDRYEKRDQPSADNHRSDSKDNGKKAEQPKGTPVPCDADALIAAITLANARGGATLNLATDCTYLLTTDIDGAGLPAITTPITLNGNKHTTIERAAATDQFRILTINTGGNLTLNHLKLTGGGTTDAGGAILVNTGGTLTTNHSTITRNITDSNGGAISSDGTTYVNHSTISHNTAGNVGGGITNFGLLDVKKSKVNANTAAAAGGGVMSFGTAQIAHSTIATNSAPTGTIGGVYISGTGTVTDSRITKNTATEAAGVVMDFNTQLTLKSVTLVGNTATSGRAGGLATSDNSSVVIEGSVIANNTAATEGGGIYNLAELVSRNTKIIGNQADQGAGIFNLDTATLVDTKVVKNVAITDGGGIFNDGGTVELNTATGTIVIKNRPNNCVDVPSCAG